MLLILILRIVNLLSINGTDSVKKTNNFDEQSEETTYKSKHGLWNQVKGGEKVEQPHGSEDRHPEEKLDVYLKILPATLPWSKVIGQG